MKFYR